MDTSFDKNLIIPLTFALLSDIIATLCIHNFLSRIRYTTGKRNSALFTTFAFTLAVKVDVEVPVFWTLGTTAMVLQQINTFQKFVQWINYL